MPFTAEYDSFTFETNDPVFYHGIQNGTSEPYPLHLAIVRRYLEMFPTHNNCYIDIGAHIGTTVAPYSRLFSLVHAYEPSRMNYTFLEKNVQRNNLVNCKIYNIGLYSHECNGSMKYHGGGNSGCYAFEPLEFGDTKCISLDSQNHEFVDFIKVDTEGSELYVLKGAENTLRRWKPLIQFETNNMCEKIYGIKIEQTIHYLQSLGYVVFDSSDPNNLFMHVPNTS